MTEEEILNTGLSVTEETKAHIESSKVIKEKEKQFSPSNPRLTTLPPLPIYRGYSHNDGLPVPVPIFFPFSKMALMVV